MQELIKKCSNKIAIITKGVIRQQDNRLNGKLYCFNRGIKKWYFSVCHSCGHFSSFAEAEKDMYMSKKDWIYYVTCPYCGIREKKDSYLYDIGATLAKSDGTNFVSCECSIKTYPACNIITSCKLKTLSYKDIYDQNKNIEKERCDYFEDYTEWEDIWHDLMETDKNKEWYPKVSGFMDKIKISDELNRIIIYLFLRENKNFLKIITECKCAQVEKVLILLFNDFNHNNCDKKYESKLRLSVKSSKKLTEDTIRNGEVFTMPLENAGMCKSLDKFDSFRKTYIKMKCGDDFNKIMDAASISDDIKFINSLRSAMSKIKDFDPNQIVDICIMQYLFNGTEFSKTCQTLSRNAANISDMNFYKPSLMDIGWTRERNRWYIGWLENKCGNEYIEQNRKLKDCKPDSEVIFDDDMYELSRSIENTISFAKKRALYLPALFSLYEKNIAYLYKSINSDKCILARNNGRILLRGNLE